MIYAKLDWYSCMLQNVSIRWVLEHLNCFYDAFEEILSEPFETSNGWETKILFAYGGIHLEVKWFDHLSVSDDVKLDESFSVMRVEFTGSGLDYLRTKNDNFDKQLSDINFWGDKFKSLTRCDFAYDFVNYYPTFLDDFIFRITELERMGFLQTNLLGCRGAGRKFKYRISRGSGINCLYLGSTGGGRYVRVYDKLLEQSDENGALKNSLPTIFSKKGDTEVTSWFRFEIQCRRKYAYDYLFNCGGDLTAVLREYFDASQIIDPEWGEVFECMRKLIDWSSIQKIVYNLHYTE